jgi:hypothetical protein
MEILLGFLVLAALVMVAAELYPRAWAALDAWRETRGKRVIVCPETGTCEAVSLDTRHAAATAAVGDAALQLSTCTRWPERAGCGQECLAQIEAAPDGCLVRLRLEAWYAGSACALCGQHFGQIRWFDHKPGLLAPDQKPVGWQEVAPEDVPAALETHRPLCWNCYISEAFRAARPELVTDNPWHRAPRREAEKKVS